MNGMSESKTSGIFWAVLLLGLFSILAPQSAFAADVKVSGWIPWWAGEEGMESAIDNMRELETIYPFVYEIDEEGDIVAKTDLETDEWEDPK